MRLISKILLFLVLGSVPSWASFGLVQNLHNNCSSGTSCTFAVTGTGGGHLLTIAFFSSNNTSGFTISSISDDQGGSWAICTACAQNGSGSGGAIGGGYNLSSVSGTTSITVKISPTEGAQWVIDFREYSLAGTATLDTSNSSSGSSCTSCAGQSFGTTASTDEMIIQWVSGKLTGNSFTAISGSYGNTEFFANTKACGIADWLNTGTTSPGTPNWTQASSGTVNVAAMVFKESGGAGVSVAPRRGIIF